MKLDHQRKEKPDEGFTIQEGTFYEITHKHPNAKHENCVYGELVQLQINQDQRTQYLTLLIDERSMRLHFDWITRIEEFSRHPLELFLETYAAGRNFDASKFRTIIFDKNVAS